MEHSGIACVKAQRQKGTWNFERMKFGKEGNGRGRK